MGSEVLPVVQRRERIHSSSQSAASQRPKAQEHLDSFSFDEERLGIFQPRKITLVDDVVTRGATLLAAAPLFRAHLPKAEIRGFSLIRTMSGVDIESVREPCTGTIRLSGEETFRRP